MCFDLRFTVSLVRPLAEEKELPNDGEGEVVKIKEVKVFQLERTTLLNSRAPLYFQWNPQSKRLKYAGIEEQAV